MEPNPASSADEILEKAKGKYPVVLLIGVTGEDVLDFMTNIPQYQYMQWLLNKGSFELYIHERTEMEKKKSVNES